MRGSIGTSLRSLNPTLFSYGSVFASSPLACNNSAAFFRASKRSSPCNSGTAGQLIRPSGCQNIDNRQVMALADFEIERVVRGRDFQNTGPEFRIDCFVGNDRNFLACERTPGVFA